MAAVRGLTSEGSGVVCVLMAAIFSATVSRESMSGTSVSMGSVGSHHQIERKVGGLALTLTDAEANPGAVALTCPGSKRQ